MAALRRSLGVFLPASNHLANSSFLVNPCHLTPSRGFMPDKCSIDADSNCNDEISKIRNEFEEAKRNFLNIPAALKEMPTMNPEGIYINKNLKLDDLHVYGFDYDYTLSHYSENLQVLIYDLAKKHLVYELKYPESCLQFEYDAKFPVRGLYYDRQKGCLLKLDFFGSIETDGCFHGRKKLSVDKIKELYGTRHIGRGIRRGLVALMDFFCFSEACLIADIVQHFVDAKLDFDTSYVYDDINHAIQHVHRSGLVHRQILAEPHKFLMKNERMLQFLQLLKEKGKKLFLLTNSPFYFVDGGMSYMLEGYNEKGSSWRELFDVVIAQANKPTFYNSEYPFRSYDIEKDTLAFSAVDRLLPNQVYYHGSLKSFLQITKWKGPEVIYFGDHLFSDLKGPAKAGWRTAAIIHELEDEIKIQNSEPYRLQEAKLYIILELLGKIHATVVSTEKGQSYKSLLDELNLERQKCRAAIRDLFNSSFGATFSTDTGKESSFAYHIHQHADVYTSKPENFLAYPPESWLHPPYDIKIMPHHVKVPGSLFKGSC